MTDKYRNALENLQWLSAAAQYSHILYGDDDNAEVSKGCQ